LILISHIVVGANNAEEPLVEVTDEVLGTHRLVTLLIAGYTVRA
jgi:hypothetical protein